MDPRYWQIEDAIERQHFRHRNAIGRGTLTRVDDTGASQVLQFEGYITEVRNGMQRIGMFGFSSVPLVGASAATLHQGGDRGFNTAVGIEDGRYRPKNYKGGESVQYIVDGADAKGKGGTLRKILEGLLDWKAKLYGKTIDIGTTADTETITIKSSVKVVIQAPAVEISNGGTLQAVKLADGSNSTVLKAQ